MMKKHKRVLIGAFILVIIFVPILLHLWKQAIDRSYCQINMYRIHMQICGQASWEFINPGQDIPGGISRLLDRADYTSLPVCPSGGTYSFVSETTYSGEGVNSNVRCSHAIDLGHVYPDETIQEAEQ
jgi:hypothetical protein